jgi:predicted transposase YbfD/YdcC
LLIDIVVIAVLGVISNADTWKDIHVWAESQHKWLASILTLPNGIPSRDTIRRTISRLNPQEFQQCFLRWLKALRRGVSGVVAIDGKTSRRSMDAELGPLHLVSACACEQHLTLGQVRVSEKSNEITAIPELLKLLELKGAIVTIDAMGCQKEIAAQIIDRGGNYVLAVKDHQPKLSAAIGEHFLKIHEHGDYSSAKCRNHKTEESRHGRLEERTVYVTPLPESFAFSDDWKGIRSLGQVITYTERDGKNSTEVRNFISSLPPQVRQLASEVRSHWRIENSLHWILDVTYRKDESHIRKDHGVQNVGWLRRIAISLLKNDTSIKDSVRGKRIRAGYDIEFLKEILRNVKFA